MPVSNRFSRLAISVSMSWGLGTMVYHKSAKSPSAQAIARSAAWAWVVGASVIKSPFRVTGVAQRLEVIGKPLEHRRIDVALKGDDGIDQLILSQPFPCVKFRVIGLDIYVCILA